MSVDATRFAAYYPRLYHVAEPQSWDLIAKHGLLSTTALLDFFKVKGKKRFAAESRRRSAPIPLTPDGTVVLRDQLPINESKLEACLVSMTTQEWYEALNRRVFFWPTNQRLLGMLKAGPYRARKHLVLTLDTAALLRTYLERVELSRINSGSTLYNPSPRGRDTFLALDEYPFEELRKARGPARAVAELTVDYAVHNVLNFVSVVEVRRGTEVLETLSPPTRQGID